MHRLRIRAAGPVAVLLIAGLLGLASPAHAAGPADLYATASATGAPQIVATGPSSATPDPTARPVP